MSQEAKKNNYQLNISFSKCKLLEELSELQEVLLKSVTREGYEDRIIEELGDVKARIKFFCEENLILDKVNQRKKEKLNKIKNIKEVYDKKQG
jgi:regulator of replication initiation timing